MGGETRLQGSNAQLGLEFEAVRAGAASRGEGREEERFLSGAEGDFYLGAQRLDQYLCANQQGWVVRLRALLQELDWSQFTSRYQERGRRPLHPRVLLGLVLYGIMRGEWSLRNLERLALVDLGAWWITGRLQPDHSTIGKFIQLHAQLLSEGFCQELVKYLVGKLQVSAGTVAVDGTVIDAVASRYRLLRAEALQEQGVERAAERILAQRSAERAFRGRDGGATRLAAGEPEAMVQVTKQGVSRASYKPSAMRHESGLVVAQTVHPSSETAVVLELVAQHAVVFQLDPPRLLGDAGYSSIEVLRELSARDIDVLIAPGTRAHPMQPHSAGGRLLKSEFCYDPVQDLYRCPAQRTLLRDHRGYDGRRSYVQYRGRHCTNCELRVRCTSAAAGRTLKRYTGEAYKEAMAQVLRQPAALRQWRRRAGIIEPLFAALRERQRLTRFHRRGLGKVKLEFALHCAAFNLRQVVAGRHFLLCLTLFARRPPAPWSLTACVWVLLSLPPR